MKQLKEALGVPQNIVNLSIELAEKIETSIPENIPAKLMDNKTLEFDEEFTIANIKFNKVKVTFMLDESRYDSELELLAMGVAQQGIVTSNLKIQRLQSNTFEMVIKLLVGDDITSSDIKNYLFNENRNKVISSITHELKHFYDIKMYGFEQISSRAKYRAITEHGFANITPLNEFLMNLYFIHDVENLVRPSEIATLLKTGNVTKKDFYDFFMNQDIIKKLIKIRSFSLSKLKEELINYLPQIKNLFNRVEVDYSNLSSEQIIDKMLELTFINLINWQAKFAYDMLVQTDYEFKFGFEGRKEIFWNNYLKKISKYEKNPQAFFLNEEKNMKFIANKILKKVAKLYALTKDLKTESIINWEKWYDLVSKKTIVERTFKFNI